MSPLKLKAPAKVNLYLRVVRKRPDGFHEIETLFERIGLYDEFSFKKTAGKLKLTILGQRLSAGKDNLIMRAARLLKERHHVQSGAHIVLKKNIPIAAGLAGGSTDAATALIGLNRLWKLRVPSKRLMRYAAELGSDVAFFISNASFAWGKGRGEKLQIIKSRAKVWHVLVKPPIQVLTKHVYGGLTPGLLTLPRPDARMLLNVIRESNLSKLDDYLFNTLEFVVMAKHPVIKEIRNELYWQGADRAMVSGSGPTVFGIVKTEKQARKIATALRKKYPKAFVAAVSTL